MPRFKLDIGGRILEIPVGNHNIGRMSDCWLTIDDDRISRYHARLHVTPDHLEVEDLESRNGTFVNGQQVERRVELHPGDQLRVGRETIRVMEADAVVRRPQAEMRRTMAGGEDTWARALLAELAEKSLRVGSPKDAERFALALANQLLGREVPADDPKAKSCVKCLLGLADQTASGVWIDRLFRLYAVQRWVMSEDVLDSVRGALDRIPRIPGTGMPDYERTLREMLRDGIEVRAGLANTIAELVDAYGAS